MGKRLEHTLLQNAIWMVNKHQNVLNFISY